MTESLKNEECILSASFKDCVVKDFCSSSSNNIGRFNDKRVSKNVIVMLKAVMPLI